ncbi:M-phase-specific PLK1-interacting protein [Archocentrus centrarchus]|uniref:M-phase-specific PLK1-interacting protein n=1 Tax=Archocentrus centrarchus TaxID=63155 RepID=UPI0011E9E8BB|nr:M-phase-specific PLK1-interacting protein [Archocentrus centrarchus]
MFRAPDRPQRSPGAPRPAGSFCSPSSGWGFPRSPYGGSPYGGSPYRGSPYGGSPHGGFPRGYSPYSPCSPGYSPGSNRGYRDGSAAGFGSGSRGFGGPMRQRGNGFRRPQSYNPTSAPNFKSSDAPVQKYFNPSMMQDPWKNLQPVTTTDAAAARRST